MDNNTQPRDPAERERGGWDRERNGEDGDRSSSREWFDARGDRSVERACKDFTRNKLADLLGAKDGRKNAGERATLTEGKREREGHENGARDFICRTLFGTRFKPTSEPKEHEAERGYAERTVEWMGLDSFLTEKPVGDWGEFLRDAESAVKDFQRFRTEMLRESTNEKGKVVNVAGRDKYYHCMANCVGNGRGPGGEIASAVVSTVKEVKDVAKAMICRDWSYGAATRDSMRDQTANRLGRDPGRSGLRCEDACRSDRLQFIDHLFR